MTGADDDDASDTALPVLDPREVVDAASEEGQRKASRERKRRQRREAEFVRAVLADDRGREFIWGILRDGGLFATPFACGPNGFPQPEATWFKAGQQALVTGLYHRLLAIDLDGVRLMLSENDSRFKEVKR